MMRRAGLACLLALVCAGAQALDHVTISTADDSNLTRRIADDLKRRIASIPGTLPRPVVVTIGPVALRREVSQRLEGVIVSAYTSSQVWHSLVKPTPGLQVTGVYAEPGPAEQLKLVSLLYKRPVRIAALLSSDLAFLHSELPDVMIQPFDERSDINVALNRIAQAQVLLAMPDRAAFTTENVRNVLLSTYRHGQGVIGFSADMVKSGALATTYSDLEDVDTQVAEILANYAQDGTLPPPSFPRYFKTIVNEGVARSLNVPLDDTARKFARRPGGGGR
ncbi:MAG TPA: hypothetical protein VFF16_09965 [Telluria sp.]|nr:hypothetical protein [Telluria sp.]